MRIGPDRDFMQKKSSVPFRFELISRVLACFAAWTCLLILGAQAQELFGPPMNFTTGKKPEWIAVGDFNGDAKPDLAVANSSLSNGSNNVSVLLNNGIGGFESPVN